MDEFKDYQDQSWVVGVSGGPDSMALLHMLMKQKIEVFVLHVNYHQRESADRDEAILRRFCERHQLPFEIAHYPKGTKGNFQKNARDFRYGRMAELASDRDGIMVAHHLDDDLETYVWQKERKILPSNYGLQTKQAYRNTWIVRPLLKRTKAELLAYCEKHSIEYGEDETNHSLSYSRNRIRKMLERLSQKERKQLNTEKELMNQKLHLSETILKESLKQNSFQLEEFLQQIKYEDFLRLWLRKHYKTQDLSQKEVDEIKRQLVSASKLILHHHDRVLIKQYHAVKIIPAPQAYCFVFNHEKELLAFLDKKNLILKEEVLYPITLIDYRQAKEKYDNEVIKVLRRQFIKHKIPWEVREEWPLRLNGNQAECLKMELKKLDHKKILKM